MPCFLKNIIFKPWICKVNSMAATFLVGMENSLLVFESTGGYKKEIHEGLKGTSPQKVAEQN
jgi:hypothetical protein